MESSNTYGGSAAPAGAMLAHRTQDVAMMRLNGASPSVTRISSSRAMSSAERARDRPNHRVEHVQHNRQRRRHPYLNRLPHRVPTGTPAALRRDRDAGRDQTLGQAGLDLSERRVEDRVTSSPVAAVLGASVGSASSRPRACEDYHRRH